MTKRAQRKADKRTRDRQRQAVSREEAGPLYRPKPGPGQVFKQELVGMNSGHAKRLRNIGITSLFLAYWRGQLCTPTDDKYNNNTAEDRLAAGERFEKLWYEFNRSWGRDCTELRINASDQMFFTDAKEDAGRLLRTLAARMQVNNYLIVRAFCGEGHSMPEAIRVAGLAVHRAGTAYRVREALDDLVYAVTGARPTDTSSRKPITDNDPAQPLHPFHDIA